MRNFIILILIAVIVILGVARITRADVSLKERIAEIAGRILGERLAENMTVVLDDLGEKVFGGVAVDSSLMATTSATVYDLVGTRVGTTTTGVGFGNGASGGLSSTSSYPFHIGFETNTVSLFFDVVRASSTPDGRYRAEIYSSNDANCQSDETTTNDANKIVSQDVKWYDAGRHIAELVGVTNQTTGTTTLLFEQVRQGDNDEITLTNLHSRCLMLGISGSSTELQVQVVRKGLLGGF